MSRTMMLLALLLLAGLASAETVTWKVAKYPVPRDGEGHFCFDETLTRSVTVIAGPNVGFGDRKDDLRGTTLVTGDGQVIPQPEHVDQKAVNPGEWWIVEHERLSRKYELGEMDNTCVEGRYFGPHGLHTAFTAFAEGHAYVDIDGVEHGPYRQASTVVTSPDGAHTAYVMQDDRGWFVVRDGTPQGPFTGTALPTFTPDSAHLWCRVLTPEGWHRLYDTTLGPAFPDLREGQQPPPDMPGVAYIARVDGPPTPAPSYSTPTGDHHLDGFSDVMDIAKKTIMQPWLAGEYGAITPPGGHEAVVVGGVAGKTYAHIHYLFPVGADGHVRYLAELDGKITLVDNGKEGPWLPPFAVEKAILTWGVQSWRYDDAHVDGFRDDQYTDTVITSPDGRHWAYCAKIGDKYAAVRDNHIDRIYTAINWSDWNNCKVKVHFSADSRHLAYTVGDGHDWFVVTDGVAGRHYTAVGDIFSFDTHGRAQYGYQKGNAYYFSGMRLPECENLNGITCYPSLYLRVGDRYQRVIVVPRYNSMSSPYECIGTPVRLPGAHAPLLDGPPLFFYFRLNVKNTGIRKNHTERCNIIDGKIVNGNEHTGIYIWTEETIGATKHVTYFESISKTTERFVIDGRPGPVCEKVSGFHFNADCTHWAYIAKRNGTEQVISDGTPGPVYRAINNLDFYNGHLGYLASINANAYAIVIDGAEHRYLFNDLFPGAKWAGGLSISPDARHLFYTLGDDKNSMLIVDGQRSPTLAIIDTLPLAFLTPHCAIFRGELEEYIPAKEKKEATLPETTPKIQDDASSFTSLSFETGSKDTTEDHGDTLKSLVEVTADIAP